MYVCVYAYISIYIYVHTYVYLCTCICACIEPMWMYKYIYIYIYIYICVCVCAYIRICACIEPMWMYIYKCVCAYIRILICICAFIDVYVGMLAYKCMREYICCTYICMICMYLSLSQHVYACRVAPCSVDLNQRPVNSQYVTLLTAQPQRITLVIVSLLINCIYTHCPINYYVCVL